MKQLLKYAPRGHSYPSHSGSSAMASCRKNSSRTIRCWDYLSGYKQQTTSRNTSAPRSKIQWQSGGGTSGGQGGAGTKAGGAASGGAPPAIVLDKEMKKAIVLAVKSEMRRDSISNIDCRNYHNTGACRFGELCKFRHGPGDTRFDGNALKPEHAIKVNEAIQENRKKHVLY